MTDLNDTVGYQNYCYLIVSWPVVSILFYFQYITTFAANMTAGDLKMSLDSSFEIMSHMLFSIYIIICKHIMI